MPAALLLGVFLYLIIWEPDINVLILKIEMRKYTCAYQPYLAANAKNTGK